MYIEGSGLAELEAADLFWDLAFYMKNPELPIENLCSRFNNFKTPTEGHIELCEYAKMLLDLNDSTASAGLYMWGSPGIGKSHMGVALGKEFLKRGQDVIFASAEKLGNIQTKDIPKHNVYIIDDLNSPYGFGAKKFLEIVLDKHNRGGRIFVTSNIDYDTFMNSAFVGCREEQPRYMDRTKGMFKVIHIEDESNRAKKAWYI